MRFRRLADVFGVLVRSVVALVAIVIVVAAVQVARAILTVSSDPLRDAELRVLPATPSSGVAGMLARGERTNLLLLGYGGAGHDGAFLTDSQMLASLEPRSGVVTLVSIPRDLWVTLPKSKYAPSFSAKVNEAFAIAATQGDRDGGIRIGDQTLEAVLGITIHRAVAIDFRAFRTVVDALGGIDIVVDRSFQALYPRNDDPEIDPAWIEIAFKAGPQHMDGETALRYARARYSDGLEGSDFARSLRQQKVILAAKDRVVATNAVPQLFGLLEALRENVRTDLSIADMQALSDFARSYDDRKTIKAALTPENALQNGYSQVTGYALWPKVQGWSEVQAYVRRVLEYPRSLAEDAPVIVAISRARATIGEEAVRRLEDLGFRARSQLTQDPDPSRTTIGDGTAGRGEVSALFLVDYFGRALVTAPSSSDAIVVRLGRDWTPPLEFEAPNETLKGAEPSASPAPVGSPRPDASAPATRTPRPTITPPRPTLPRP